MDMNILTGDYEKLLIDFYGKYQPRGSEGFEIFYNDAIYHKKRYLDILNHPFGDHILEVGGDKPFFTYLLRELNPQATVQTISIDIPITPYPIISVDIEIEKFPLRDAVFTDVLFLEVIEHLYRNPSLTISEINRVLKIGGNFFITTPNACSYESVQKIFQGQNPNGRSQFFIYLESRHHRLWTISEIVDLIIAHGFETSLVTTKNYYDTPIDSRIADFLKTSNPDLHNQVVFVKTTETADCHNPVYPESLFPDKRPVQVSETVRRWTQDEKQKTN